MVKLFKVVSLATISVTLAIAAISADAGFALGLDQENSTLAADTIQVDPALLAADQQAVEAAKSESVIPMLDVDGNIFFVPGTGTQPKISDSEANFANEEALVNEEPVAETLAELVHMQEIDGELTEDEKCLAGTIFFESKGESLAGQLAVAKVVLARAASNRFPSSLCDVVYQKRQFSFIRGNKMPPINETKKSWKTAIAISKIALDDAWESPVEGALFFHARYVSPGWRLTRLGRIDNHIFYR